MRNSLSVPVYFWYTELSLLSHILAVRQCTFEKDRWKITCGNMVDDTETKKKEYNKIDVWKGSFDT